jgi:hypothetical protein
MARKDLSKATVSLVNGQRDIPLNTHVIVDNVRYGAVRVRHLLAYEVGQFIEEAVASAAKLVESEEDVEPPGLRMFSLMPVDPSVEPITDLSIADLEHVVTDEDRNAIDAAALDFLPYRLRVVGAQTPGTGAATSQASQPASTPPSEKSETSPGGNS